MFPSRRIDQTTLFHVALCIVPTMALLGIGAYTAAAYTLFGLFGVFFSYALAQRNPRQATALMLGCLPGMMFLRDSFYYSSVEVLLTVTVLSWQVLDKAEFDRIFLDPIVKSLVWFAVVYWSLSYLLTRDYSANLRIFELVFAAISFRLLAKHRQYAAAALWGVALAGFALGITLSGQGERLGMVRNTQAKLGNPITFGMPMAMIFLLSLVDGGRRLMLENRPFLRVAANCCAGVFLLLSTSRGSWSVVAACLLVTLLVSRNRIKVIQGLIVGIIGLSIWMRYADTAVVEKYFQKTLNSSEEWSVEYNARLAQWNSFPTAFRDSPIWGFGPGRGKQVSITYSGHSLIWHSLYLHLGIECGLIGLVPLAVMFFALFRRTFQCNRLRGEVGPLLGVVGFGVVATTIPAIDGVSGLFLGLALAGAELGREMYVLRTVVVPVAPGRPAAAAPC